MLCSISDQLFQHLIFARHFSRCWYLLIVGNSVRLPVWMQLEPDWIGRWGGGGAAPAPKFKWRRNAPRDLLGATNKLMERAAPSSLPPFFPQHICSPFQEPPLSLPLKPLFFFSSPSYSTPLSFHLLLILPSSLCPLSSSLHCHQQQQQRVNPITHVWIPAGGEGGEWGRGWGRRENSVCELWLSLWICLMQNPLLSWHHVCLCYWNAAMFSPQSRSYSPQTLKYVPTILKNLYVGNEILVLEKVIQVLRDETEYNDSGTR